MHHDELERHVPEPARATAESYLNLLADQLLEPLLDLTDSMKTFGQRSLTPERLALLSRLDDPSIQEAREMLTRWRETGGPAELLRCTQKRGEDFVFSFKGDDTELLIGQESGRWCLRRIGLGAEARRELAEASMELRKARSFLYSMLLSAASHILRWASPQPRRQAATTPEIGAQIQEAGAWLQRLLTMLRQGEEKHRAFLDQHGGAPAQAQAAALRQEIEPFWPAVDTGELVAIHQDDAQAQHHARVKVDLPGWNKCFDVTLRFDHVRHDDTWKLRDISLHLIANQSFSLFDEATSLASRF